MVDGFSSADPRLARGPQISAGEATRRRRSRGSSRSRTPSVSVIGGTVKIDGVGYSVAPSLQEKFIRDRTGGRGSSAQSAIKAAAERAAAVVAANRAAELKRIEEAKSFAEKMRIAKEIVMTRQAQAEFQRMLRFRSELIKRGAVEDKRMSTDSKTGDKLEVSQWRDKSGNRTERIKNLTKGTTTYSTYEKKKGQYVRKTGGVSMGSISTVGDPAFDFASRVKIVKSNDPNRLIVTFPNGQTGTIKSTGRVVVGAGLAGEKSVFQDGVLRQVGGVSLYEEKLKDVEVPRRDQIISMERARDLSSKWKQDIETTKSRLTAANKRGDSQRLAELQRVGKNRGPSQNIEYNKLLKETAKNYELGGELIGKIIASSLINMGVGSVELLAALKANPKATLIALPPAIYLTLKEDFNRIVSGDPLEAGNVGLEYWTFGKVGQIATKVGKTGLRTSYGIGSTLSPKYFGSISKKLLIPPVTLRGIAVKTATGRAVEKSIKNTLKQTGVTGKITAYSKKLKAGKSGVDRKLNAIQNRARKGKKVVRVKIEKVKVKLDYRKSLRDAKKIRLKAAKKGKTLPLTSPNYKQALNNINAISDITARVNTLEFLNKAQQRGVKLSKKQSDELLTAVKTQYRNKLVDMPEYQTLLRLSKQDRFLSVKLIKQGRVKAARIFFNKITRRINSLPAVSIIGKTFSMVKRGVRVRIKKVKAPAIRARKIVRRKIKTAKERVRIKKRRLVKKVRRPLLVAKQRRFVRKTIRYQMEKARPTRKVSLDKLKRSQKVSDMNKFIDNLFNELGKRQKIDVKAVRFLQTKNVLKKRMRRAINSRNLPEINNFRIAVSKMVTEMNKKSNNPNVKIVRTTGKDRRIRTLKDFESPSPKGTYREVKVGNQVMLQEVKQVQVMKQPMQKYKIVSVQKKAINLKPFLDFGVKSLSATALINILKSKQVFGKMSNQGQLLKILQDSAQDLKVLQAIAPRVNVASAVMSAVNSKIRTSPKLRTKLITKKEKKPVMRIRIKPKNTRKLSKPVMGYGFVVRKGSRNVRLKLPPLTLKDAWDVGSHRLDHQLQRTGKLIPVGMVDVVAKLPKSVAGYYKRNSKKFRRVRIRRGKVLTLQRTIIEKNRYIRDKPSEKRALQLARKKATLKRSKPKVKRKVAKRKVKSGKRQPTLNRLKSKKKELIQKRKRMINKLKKG